MNLKKHMYMIVTEDRYDFVRKPTLLNKLICRIIIARKGPAKFMTPGTYRIQRMRVLLGFRRALVPYYG